MLGEMRYTTGAEQEGKKVYTITEEGCRFFDEHKESEGRTRSQMKCWCNPENIDDIRKIVREFERLANLLQDKARNGSTEELSHMQEAISRACEEISKD